MARGRWLSIGFAFLIGCTLAPTKMFRSPDGDFQLEYPAFWEIAPNTSDLKFHARAVHGLVSANVATEQLPPGTTLDVYVDNSIAQYKSAGIEVKQPVERATITLSGGIPAVRLGVVARMPPSMNVPVDIHFDVVVAVVKGKGYALTCATGTIEARILKPVFDRIIASMRFTT